MNTYFLLYKLLENKYIDNPILTKKLFKIYLKNNSSDMFVILLEIFKNSGENITNLITVNKLVSSYVETSYEENRKFIIEELKERNFNLDNLIFA